MKYAINHPWKFDHYIVAWSAGFMQASMVICVETVNYIALLTFTNHVDIVMNFLAIAVISEFDDFFYKTL